MIKKEAENAKLLAQLFNKAEITKQRDQFEEMYYEEQNQRSYLSEKIDDLKRELTALREKDQQFTESLRADLADLQHERNSLHNNCVEKDIKIKQLMKTNLEMQAQISKLNQTIEAKGNLEEVLQGNQEYIQQQMIEKEEIHNELDKATDMLLEQEEKIKQSNQTALELLNQLKEADAEIETLKQRIKQLQSNQIYVPVKGDEVDQALAEYINCNGKALDIMFIRL